MAHELDKLFIEFLNQPAIIAQIDWSKKVLDQNNLRECTLSLSGTINTPNHQEVPVKIGLQIGDSNA